VLHRVGLSLRGMRSEITHTPFSLPISNVLCILSTHFEYSLSDLRNEKPDRHHLPDDCRDRHCRLARLETQGELVMFQVLAF
jgi:hypothetical protein